MCQNHRPVYKVSIDSHKFTVVAGLEILPCKIIVFCLGSVCAEHIPEHILLPGKIVEILMQPYRPVSRCGNLVALQIEKLVCRHIFRQDESVAVGLKHCREDNAVEHYVVLSYKVDHLCIGTLPPLFPIIGEQFLCI